MRRIHYFAIATIIVSGLLVFGPMPPGLKALFFAVMFLVWVGCLGRLSPNERD